MKSGVKYNVNDVLKAENIKTHFNYPLSPAFTFTGTWIWEFPEGSHTVTFKKQGESKWFMLVSDGRQFEVELKNGKLSVNCENAVFTQKSDDTNKWSYGQWMLVKKQ
jgi:hypothetical protein